MERYAPANAAANPVMEKYAEIAATNNAQNNIKIVKEYVRMYISIGKFNKHYPSL